MARVRALCHGPAAPASQQGGPDRQYAGRRPGGGDRDRRGESHGRARLRLHSPGRNPGHGRALQEGPDVRADRADAAAGRLLRRGRRRSARGHRSPRRQLPAGQGVRALGEALRPRSEDLDRRRQLLCRERGDRRVLGSDRRHRELFTRDGRAGDDRRWRTRRVSGRRGGPGRCAGPQRSPRPRRRGRGGGRRRGEAAARLLPWTGRGMVGPRPGNAPRRRPRELAPGL